MSALSYITYTGTGSQRVFTFPFPYMSASDIYVFVNGISVPYTYVNGSTISCALAPFAGSSVQIRRITQKEVTPVNFADGSVLLESDLDTLSTYTLYVAQEGSELDTRITNMENTIFGLGGGIPGTVYNETFTGDGEQTSFNMTAAPSSSANVEIHIGGAYQNHDTFTVNGKLLSFTEAPPAGVVVEVMISVARDLGKITANNALFTPAGGLTSTNVQSVITEVITGFGVLQLADYAALRTYVGPVKRIFATGVLGTAEPRGITGTFVLDESDSVSADNGGTIIVGGDGRRWKRVYDGDAVNAQWWGATGVGVANDTAAFNSAYAVSKRVFAPRGTYRVNLVIGNSSRLLAAGRENTIFKAFDPALPVIHFNEANSSKYYFIGGQDFSVYGEGVATTGIKIGISAGGAGTVTYGSLDRVHVTGCVDNIYVKDTVGFELNHIYSVSAANRCLRIDTNDIVTVLSVSHSAFRLGKVGVDMRGGAMVKFRMSIIESNSDVGLFYFRGADSGARRVEFDTCWFEGNGWGRKANGVDPINSYSGSMYIDFDSTVNPAYSSGLSFRNCTLASAAGAFTVYLNRGNGVEYDSCEFDALDATKLHYETGPGVAFASLRNCSTINERPSPAAYANFPARTSYNGGEAQFGFQYAYSYKGRKYTNAQPTAFSMYLVTAAPGVAATGAGAEFTTTALAAASSSYEEYDTAGCFDAPTGKFIAPQAGLYSFEALWPVSGVTAAMTSLQLGFIVNPSGGNVHHVTLIKKLAGYSAADVDTFNALKTLSLNAGDSVIAYIKISGGAGNTAEVYRNVAAPGLFRFSGRQVE
jgi:hypothetical protein